MPVRNISQIRKKINTYFNITARIVRRSFLCGEDPSTGHSYEHRRQWIVDRMDLLSQVFSVDICAYAIMNNHYHLVLHIDYEQSLTWDAKEIVQRWWQVFPPKMLQEETSDEIIAFHLDRLAADEEKIALWRERLADLSWFMRCLNESIARRVNLEDGCTGRFWEGRFKSQVLLDKSALLTCMAYVDLNPVRAKMAETPEASDYTSIKARIDESNSTQDTDLDIKEHNSNKTPPLMPFSKSQQETLNRKLQDNSCLTCLPIEKNDYFKLVDWTGRCIREDKRGAIPADLAPILKRLEIKEDQWVDGVQHYGRRFYKVVGLVRNMLDETVKQGCCWFKGQAVAKLLYE